MRSAKASVRSPRASQSSSPRSGVAAEAVLSERARATLATSGTFRTRLETAIAEIERDPSWGAGPPRYLAPATSPNSGYIVDLSVQTWGIVYRVVDKGATVEIPEIRRIFVG